MGCAGHIASICTPSMWFTVHGLVDATAHVEEHCQQPSFLQCLHMPGQRCCKGAGEATLSLPPTMRTQALADLLKSSHRGYFLPPRPDKGQSPLQDAISDSRFVADRAATLEQWLRQLQAHPVLGISEVQPLPRNSSSHSHISTEHVNKCAECCQREWRQGQRPQFLSLVCPVSPHSLHSFMRKGLHRRSRVFKMTYYPLTLCTSKSIQHHHLGIYDGAICICLRSGSRADLRHAHFTK